MNLKKISKMEYNPKIHHRRSIRLKGYDYSQAGLYFITICCEDMQCRFGNIENNEMVLNEYGNVAHNEWVKLSERFANFEVDVFQIMPNHMHGVILLNNVANVGAGFTPAQNDGQWVGAGFTPAQHDGQPQGIAPTSATIGDIIGSYKSLVANGCLKIYKSKNETMGKLWQRNYYEHIIKNESSYKTITEYIVSNPQQWDKDKFYRK